MKYMILIKANADSEAGVMPSDQLIEEMGRFNEELIAAGVMLACEGLAPSAQGARVKLGKGAPTVVDSPFAETKELLAGFWILDVKSMEEAIEWVKRIPNPDGTETEIEIRKIPGMEDFLPGEPASQDEARLRDLVGRQHDARAQA